MKKIYLIVILLIIVYIVVLLPKTQKQTDSTSSLMNTWILVSYQKDGNSNDLPQIKNAPTLTFDANNKVFGNAGCNRYNGQFTTTSQGNISFTPFATTMMMCDATSMTVETMYLKGLEQMTMFIVKPETLSLSNANGQIVMAFKRMAPLSLENTDWNVTNYNNTKEAVVGMEPNTQVSMLFENGTVSGNAGCNTYTGSYTLSDNKNITIGKLATTMRMCTEETIMQQESLFLTSLQNAKVYSITDSQMLELRNNEGALQVMASVK